jgi:hypothetical protein
VHIVPEYLGVDPTLNAIVADGVWQTPALDAVGAWLTAHPSSAATSADADFVTLFDAAVDAAAPAIVDAIANAGNTGELGTSKQALTAPTDLHRWGTWGEGDSDIGIWGGNVTVGWADNGTSAELNYELGGPNEYLPEWLQLNLISLDYVTVFSEIDKHAFNPTAAGEPNPLDIGKDRAWPLKPTGEVLGAFKPKVVYELANPLGLAINALADLGIPALGQAVQKPTVPRDRYGTYSVRFFSGAVTTERLDFIRQHSEQPQLAARWQLAFHINMLKATLKFVSLLVKLPDDQKFFNDLLAGLGPILISPEYGITELDKPGRFNAFATAFTRKALEISLEKLGHDAANALVAELGDVVIGAPSKIVAGLTTVGITSQMMSLPALHSVVLTAGNWSDCESHLDCTADAQCETDKQCHVKTSTPTVLVSGQLSPYSIATDATNVYWLNGDGTLMKCAVGGCNDSPTVVAGGLGWGGAVALDANNVYWTAFANNDPLAGSAFKCSLGGCGGTPTVLAAAQAQPYGVAVDATSVYWANALSPGGFSGGSVMKCATGGCAGNPAVLASGNLYGPSAIAVNGASVFGCGSFMTEEDRMKRPHFTSLSRGFGIGFGATPSA